MSGLHTGSFWWLPRILACEDLDATDTLLMIALVEHIDADDETFVGIERLAGAARCSYPTAKRRLAALADAGWIERTRRRRGDGNLSTYSTRLLRDRVEPGITVIPDQGSPGRSLTRDHQGDPAEPASDEPASDEPNPPSTDVDTPDPDLGFEDAWSLYPKRDGKKVGKQEARAVWRRLTLDQRREVYVAIGHYRRACDAGQTKARDMVRFIRPTNRYWQDWIDPPDTSTNAVHSGRRATVSEFDDEGGEFSWPSRSGPETPPR